MKLYYSSTPFNDFAIENTPEITKYIYKPTPYLLEGNLQTFYAELENRRIKGRHGFKYKRQLVRLEDGGQISLDWALMDIKDEQSSIIVIFPGLTGGCDNAYVGHIARNGMKEGYRCVVLNKRGCADTPLLVSI